MKLQYILRSTAYKIEFQMPKTEVSEISCGYHESLTWLIYTSNVHRLGLGSLCGHDAGAGELAGFLGEVSLDQLSGINEVGVLLQEVVNESLGFTLQSLAAGQDPGLFTVVLGLVIVFAVVGNGVGVEVGREDQQRRLRDVISELERDDKLAGFVGISSELGSTLNVLLFTFDDVGVLNDDHITVQSVFGLTASALAFRGDGNLGDFVPDALVSCKVEVFNWLDL